MRTILQQERYYLWFLVLLRLTLQLLLFCNGYEVLTSDDYLRVWVANQTSQNWRWFPDLVYLPFYFWLYAIPLALQIPLRFAAVGLTILLAAASTALIYILIRKQTSARTAFAGALLWSLQPLVVWIGGVPLSETLGIVLLLLTLLLWQHKKFTWRIVAALCLVALTLVRFEAWPLAGLLALMLLCRRNEPLVQRLVPVLISSSGMIVFFCWRLSLPDPVALLLFLRQNAKLFMPVEHVTKHLMTAAAALTPMMLPTLVLTLLWLPKLWQSRSNLRPSLVVALGSSVSLIPLVASGYYAHLFPERMLLLPCCMWTITGMVVLSNWLDRLSKTALLLLALLSSLLLFGLSSKPQVIVKPETVQAGKLLRELLQTVPPSEQILVERRDLGWTALWGLSDGNQRIRFHRRSIRPRPLTNPRKAAALFQAMPQLSCALAASRSGAKAIAATMPANWQTKWRRSKYTLFCRPGVRIQGESG